MLFSRIGLITSSLIPLLGSGIYNQGSLFLQSPEEAPSDLILPRRNTTIFGSDSVDYGLKFSRCPARTPQEMGKSEG